jgi:regulatory protein
MNSEKSDRFNFSGNRWKRGGLSTEQALQKLRHYCGYQERSHAEVEQKLWDLGVHRSEHGHILSTLIEEDYLNEQRFAIAFAGGRFRMKDWGRKKIYYALKEKKVSEYNIKRARKEIDEDDYLKKLNELAEKKYASLKGEQYLVRKKKTIDYLLQKGYEPDLINESLKQFTGKN